MMFSKNIGTTPTEIVPQNFNRENLALMNVGSESVYISDNIEPTVANSFPLAIGMSITMILADDKTMIYRQYFGISATGNGVIKVMVDG
jgi:hypothetical protein